MAKIIKYTTLAVLLVFAVALLWSGLLLPNPETAYASPYGLDGEGTPTNPYKIDTVEHWLAVITFANTANTGGTYFELRNDLDMTGLVLTPIGTNERPFNGKLVGNGRVISNITVEASGDYAGLFGYIGTGGEISDLGVFAGQVSGVNMAGGLAARNDGIILRSFSTVSVYSSGGNAGGLVGLNNGRIKNSYATGSVTSDGGYAGGVAGYLGEPMQTGDSLAFTYSLGRVQGVTVGGVVGGRGAAMPFIRYSYFNRTANPSLSAIGSGLAVPGDAGGNITSGSNRVEGLLQNNFNNLTTLRFNDAAADNAWRAKYTVNNFSAYFALNLYVFQKDGEPINNYSYNSVIIRRYGIKENGAGEWGTATNPYVISTPEHLVNLSIAVNQNNASYSDCYFYVANDLNFDGVTFEPIGYFGGTPFSGTFDGGNFTFSNIKMDGDNGADYVAMFGYTDNKATITNLRFDETCSFAGRKNIATVSAFNRGKIINVESRARVRGTSNVGGIAGENSSGTLTNVLSAVVFTKNPGAQVYGVIGASVNSVLKNVWFFTRYNAECTEVGGAGSMLIVDRNGDVSAHKAEDGKITFSEQGTSPLGYRVEFRTENQVAVGQNNIYAPDPNSTAQLTVFARFVRELTLNEPAAGTIKLLNAVTNQQVNEGLYYEGQSASAVITVNGSYFLKQLRGKDIFAQPMESIRDLVYSYDANASVGGYTVINVTFVVTGELRELSAEIEDIGATSVPRRYYDGTPTVYNYVKPGLGTDYVFEYSYGSGGQAPVNASESAYTLNVIVKRDGVVRGIQSVSFFIDKRPLQIPEEALGKIKEYDGKVSGVYVPIAVDQNIIASHTHSGLGQNIVTMDIVQGGTHRVVVKAFADFGGAEIGDNRIVRYRFELEGFSAGNYSVPESAIYSGGAIIKRTVVYQIEEERDESDPSLNRRLTRVFDGTGAAVSHYGVVYGKGGVDGVPVYPQIGFAIDDGNGNLIPDPAINAGEYTLTIATGNPSYYNVIFDKEYKFVVTPKPVQVTFTGTTLTYNTAVQTIGGYFYDIDGRRFDLTADYFTYVLAGSPQTAVELMNAGLYIATVTLRDNYVAIDTPTPSGLDADQTYVTVNKAQQAEFTVNPIPGNHTYGDAPRQLSTSGGSGDGEVTFSVSEGFAQTEGDMLIFTGGGLVKIVAVKAESANYLRATAEREILVQKVTLTISLDDIEVFYGDTPFFGYKFEGYVAGDSGIPAGFAAPGVLVDGEPYDSEAFYPVKLDENGAVIGYLLTIGRDAASNGYEFDYAYFDANDVYLFVNKKAITVRADYAYSVYGDENDAPLTYSVYEIGEGGTERLLAPEEYNLVITLIRGEGRNAGLYTIACGEGTAEENAGALALANPNYEITFVEGSYEIRPKTLYFTLIGAHTDEATGIKYNKKYYGEDDPELLEGRDFTVTGLAAWDTVADAVSGKNGASIAEGILRSAGENAYSALYPDLPYGFYSYLATGLQVSPNYTLNFSGINLRIYPAAPTIGEQQDIFLQYGDSLSTINPASKIAIDAQGTLQWATPNLVPDFTEAAVLTFDVLFTSSDKNYVSTVLQLSVGVIPREITITFTGNDKYVYNGREQKQIGYTVNNGLPGDEFTEPLAYYLNGELTQSVKNAGEYTAAVVINNANYKIVGESEFTFVIEKAPLLIYLEDISLPETQTPKKNFIYEGFVNGETASVLTELPDVVFETKVGNYEITPFGAASPNYQISYRTSMQHVTKTLLTSEIAGFVLHGNFNSLTEYTLEEIRKSESKARYAAIEESYNVFKALNPAFAKMKTALVFGHSFTVGEEKVALSGTARATLELPVRLRESKEFGVILIKADGTVVEAKNVIRDGNKLSFDMEDCEYFAVTAPPDYTWIYLMGTVAVLFVSAFVLDMVSERLGIGRHSAKRKQKKAEKGASA